VAEEPSAAHDTAPMKAAGHRALSCACAVALAVSMLTACGEGAQVVTVPPIASQADQAAVACSFLRGVTNSLVDIINEASAAAAETPAPVERRQAFLDAVAAAEAQVTALADAAEAELGAVGEGPAALAADLARRSGAALIRLRDMRSDVAAWPDDDTETRGARTQQAFIWFEGVLASLKPDLAAYRDSSFGAAVAAEDDCSLTFRR
jgi:hypothetical protein